MNPNFTEKKIGIADATSCRGWTCSLHGQYCPPGVPGSGSGGPGYCCRSGTWKSGKC